MSGLTDRQRKVLAAVDRPGCYGRSAEGAQWRLKNPPPTQDRYRNVVDEMIANGDRNRAYRQRWCDHIDPITKAWWAERGFEQFYEGRRSVVHPSPDTPALALFAGERR